MGLEAGLCSVVALFDLRRVIFKLADVGFPRQEKHTLARVHGDFLISIGVKLYPVHRVSIPKRQSGLDLHGDDWSLLSLVGPIPKRNRLQFRLSSDRHDVLIVSGEIHAENTVRMRV